MADFALLESQRLISRKIWVIEKSRNFHTVIGTHSVHYTARVVLAAATQILQRCPNQSCKRLVKVLWCGGSSYTLVVAKSCLLLLGWYFDNVQRPPFTRTTIRPSADFIRSFGTTFTYVPFNHGICTRAGFVCSYVRTMWCPKTKTF